MAESTKRSACVPSPQNESPSEGAASSTAASASASSSTPLRSFSSLRLPLQLNVSSVDLPRSFGSFGSSRVPSSLCLQPPPKAIMLHACTTLRSISGWSIQVRGLLPSLALCCVRSCHAGHTLSPFMIDHKQTYAACDCIKGRCGSHGDQVLCNAPSALPVLATPPSTRGARRARAVASQPRRPVARPAVAIGRADW